METSPDLSEEGAVIDFVLNSSPSSITLDLTLSDLLKCPVRRSLGMSKKELLLMLLTLVQADVGSGVNHYGLLEVFQGFL